MRPTSHAALPPFWFVATLALLVATQIVRLQQTSPPAWLALDYAGRIGALLLLWLVPAARAVAFTSERLRAHPVETILWTLALAAFYLIIDRQLTGVIDGVLPRTRLGHYPALQGWLYVIDLTFGLALVAWQEEIVFRRCARTILRGPLGDGWAMIIAAALMFGAYHWWTGIGNMVTAALFGIAAMGVYRHVGALWPVVLAHFLSDLVSFS
jgi:uncharacterized protein